MATSRRILMVEDDEDGALALCALLETWGHRVSVARTGQRAVDIATAEMPEVVVTDLALPDMVGSRMIQAIRSLAGGGDAFIIAYSGFHRLERLALEAGCDAFILKPKIEGLQALLETGLALRRVVKRPGCA